MRRDDTCDALDEELTQGLWGGTATATWNDEAEEVDEDPVARRAVDADVAEEPSIDAAVLRDPVVAPALVFAGLPRRRR